MSMRQLRWNIYHKPFKNFRSCIPILLKVSGPPMSYQILCSNSNFWRNYTSPLNGILRSHSVEKKRYLLFRSTYLKIPRCCWTHHASHKYPDLLGEFRKSTEAHSPQFRFFFAIHRHTTHCLVEQWTQECNRFLICIVTWISNQLKGILFQLQVRYIAE